MGLFLAMSGVANTSPGAVVAALAAYAAERGGEFDALADKRDRDPDGKLVLRNCGGGKVVVLYPDDFLGWDDAAKYLSKKLAAPVFSFHIHDGDFWMYTLFDRGRRLDQFNPVPDYWEELTDREARRWAGDAGAVRKHWPGVTESQIRNYLVRWPLEDDDDGGGPDPPGPAYPDDEYETGEDWQLLDFMRRLGLNYPVSASGRALGDLFVFRIPDPDA